MDLSLSISTSGMIAQRRRLEVALQNLAHQFTLLDAEGNYASTNGVKLSSSPTNKGLARRSPYQRYAAAYEIRPNPRLCQRRWVC